MIRRDSAQPETAVIWNEEFLSYRWGPTHPMNPVRLALTMSLARSLHVLDGVDLAAPLALDDFALEVVHTPEYVGAVRSAGMRAGGIPNPLLAHVFGLGNDDNPVFEGMHEAARLLVGGTMAAAEAVGTGVVRRAVNIGGGMHHAMPSHAAGFCLYNDAAIAIKWLLDHGFDRIAYVDIDAHHGDGVQAEFIADPRVMTVSIHQHPATLFPGTGYATEVGDGEAAGTAVNIALMPGTDDRLWLRAFHAVVPSVIAAFAPQILITQCGVDSHRADPLTDLALTVDGQRAALLALRDLAETHCEGRWVAIGGGGYGLVNVVPRIWTHLLAVALDRDVDPATGIDQEWVDEATKAAATVKAAPPEKAMTDGGDVQYSAWDGDGGAPPPAGITEAGQSRTDQAIQETRRAVFPLHSLDPEDPRD